MAPAIFDGFVHAAHGRVVNGRGEPILLRGVGLGNWLLPEGYMWKFEPPGPQSPRQIESLVEDLVGADRAAEFWREFRDRFIAEDDIARIAAEGMNHVRLPINARVVITDDGEPLEDGFALIDRLIDWCRAHRLWVILDLHGAPGGQTGTNIDDSPHGMPELFTGGDLQGIGTDRHYRELTVSLWRMLAQRYRHEPVIAGYDLLNEPLPNEYQNLYPDMLVEIYQEITAAIREVDSHHMIIYEGTHWATNWSIFTSVWDPNSMLQFHKYWSPPDRPGIQQFLDTGVRLGLPVYMGEGGENNLDWLQTAFQLYEDCGVSWNFWPWKKIQTLTSPCSVDAPDGWADILAYASGKADKPDETTAWRTFLELLDGFDVARCTYRPDVVSALLRRVPLRLPATGFGFRGPGVSYRTTSARPLAGFRSDDLVTVQAAADEPRFDTTDGSPRPPEDALRVRLNAGEWVAYEVTVPVPTRLRIAVSTGDVVVDVDGEPVAVAGGDDGTLVGATVDTVGAGVHVIRLTGLGTGATVEWLEVR